MVINCFNIIVEVLYQLHKHKAAFPCLSLWYIIHWPRWSYSRKLCICGLENLEMLVPSSYFYLFVNPFILVIIWNPIYILTLHSSFKFQMHLLTCIFWTPFALQNIPLYAPLKSVYASFAATVTPEHLLLMALRRVESEQHPILPMR